MRTGRRLRVVTVLLATALLALAPQAAADSSYGAPFDVGPSGGDQWNRASAEPGGRVTLGRAYPVPALIGCGAGAGYALLEVVHVASAPAERVVVDFTEALIDPYVFLTVGVTDQDGEWLGSVKRRGLIAGDGSVVVPLAWGGTDVGDTLTIRFGLEVSSACPSADAGTVRFTQVTVDEAEQS